MNQWVNQLTQFGLVIVILFFYNIGLMSITPGKWSPMDKYVLGLAKNGPKQETVKDKEGNLVYTAKYEYDDEGRLIREIYTKGNGSSDGETVYSYEKNRLATEELLSAEGIQERKIYRYNPNGNLKEISVYSADGKEVLRCKVSGVTNDLIVEGEIRWIKLKETEYFNVKRDPENAKVLIQEVLDDKKKPVGTVKYFLDEKNNIIKRENIQSQTRRQSEISYNSDGKASSYNFSILKENEWVVIKTHEMSY